MWRDLRFAVRALIQQRGFAAAAIGTLALGVGATLAIFSTVNAALLRPLPYPRADDLFALYVIPVDGRVHAGRVSGVELERLNRSEISIVQAAGSRPLETALVRDGASSMPLDAVIVTGGFFELFNLPMTLGRAFRADDHVQSAPSGVVLSHHLWREEFGADPAIVGRIIRLLSGPVPVIGVAHPDLDVPRSADLWLNAIVTVQSLGHDFHGYVRVQPGGNLARLEHELAAVSAALGRDIGPASSGRRFTMEPLAYAMVGDLRATLLVILAASLLLLVLAALNVTNLLLARAAVRGREMAVRLALGAARWRVARQLLAESLVLAAGGTLAGGFFAYASVRAVLAFGAGLPRLEAIPFDGSVAVFALLTMAVTGVLVGVAPMLRLSQSSLTLVMNEGGRGATTSGSTQRLLRGMVVTEIALAIVLVAGGGWLSRSFVNLQQTDPGFVASNRLVVEIMPTRTFANDAQGVVWSRETVDYLRAVPGVSSVGTTVTLPFRPDFDANMCLGFVGEPIDPEHPDVARIRRLSPGFFDAMGIRLVAGRAFTDDDRDTTERVVIVNQAFARRFLSGRDPLSVRFTAGYPVPPTEPVFRVVGVVDDVKYASMGVPADPMYYTPQAQAPYLRQTAVLRTEGDPALVGTRVREAIQGRDPLMPIRMEPMTGIVARTLARQRLGMTLMIGFAVAAVGLAAVGIYGVLSYVASQREGEAATRMALGAAPSHVFWLLVREGRWLAVSGAVAGIGLALALGRVAGSRLFEVRASDPLVLAGAVAIVTAITAIGIVLPARRAARVDPARVLRLD
jgi:predicted permease